jgi:hypothetical protein
MNPAYITDNLSRNRSVFSGLLNGLSKEEYLWKPAPDKWCLLEIVCHLYDEEREDFRARVKHVLETPESPMPPIDPAGWVAERKYMEKDYNGMLKMFLEERERSVSWLRSLVAPPWENAYQHPKVGPVTAELIFVNWHAHDLLHMRQIIGVKHKYLAQQTKESLEYAGNW